MKTIIKIIAVLFLLINFGCSNYNGELQNAGFVTPTIKSHPRLLYPKAARDNNYSGKTEVILLVSKNGTVDDVEILRSSGYSILDSVSVEYSKNLLFNPALANGEPVSTRVRWGIQFSFSDQITYTRSYINRIKELYEEANQSGSVRKNEILNEIINLDKEFISNIWDGQYFNTTLTQVILPGSATGWDTLWNDYPLSFLLYHDFIQRFPEYDSLKMVKEELRKSLDADIKYIERTPTQNTWLQEKREQLLLRIKKFIENNYPDIKIEGDINTNFNS